MLNIEKINAAAIKTMEAGNGYLVLVVLCNKTGGRFVSVRSVTPVAFDTGLKACAKDKNFGAYNSPILESFRKYGSDGHTISLHSSHSTRKAANLAKKLLVEANAMKNVAEPKCLNYNRPVKNLPTTDFTWLSEEEIKAVKAAKRAKISSKKPEAASAVTA